MSLAEMEFKDVIAESHRRIAEQRAVCDEVMRRDPDPEIREKVRRARISASLWERRTNKLVADVERLELVVEGYVVA